MIGIGNFKYVVTSALAGGFVTIGAPGLRENLASGAAVTLAATYTANFAFSRSAILLATRAPALPQEGDMADDRITITDPRTGMAFEVSMYRQYKRVHYEIAAAWGCANIKPEHTAVLMG